MEQGQDFIIKQLYATLDPDPNVRRGSEEVLQQAGKQPGFGMALTLITMNNEQPYGIKQLAAVLLKKLVKERWQEGGRRFTPPELPEEEKQAIRQALPQGLADPLGKIRTAVGMAIASIAEHDWPHQWPDLTPTLLHGIRDKSNPHAVHGALKCLSMIAQDIDEAQMPLVVPHLFPELHVIVSHPEAYGLSLQRRAMGVLSGCVAALGVMRGAYRQPVLALLEPLLPPMVCALTSLLDRPLNFHDVADIGCKLEVFRTLTVVVQNFGKLVAPQMGAILAGTWKFFSDSVGEYEITIVNCDEEDINEVDSDGDELNLETLMSQVWEFLLTVVGSSRFSGLLANQVPDLVHLLARYMQMTRSQEVQWAEDPDQYIADEEDDTVSVRVSGEMLLIQLIETFGPKTLETIWTVVLQRLSGAMAAGAPNQGWWRVREAALLMLGGVSEHLVPFLKSSGAQGQQAIETLLTQLKDHDLSQASSELPFLRGRALWLSAKLADCLTPEHSLFFIQASLACLQPGPSNTLPLRISACRALAVLLPKVPLEVLRPLMQAVYGGLVTLMGEATEEIVHVVLECVGLVIKVDPQSAVSVEATLTPMLLQVWSAYVNDPLISQDALETVNTLATIPECLPQVLARALPPIASILGSPGRHPEALVVGALDLLPMLLKPSQPDQVRAAHTAVYTHVLALGQSSDDNGILQSVSEVLRMFVSKAGEAILDWGPGVTQGENLGLLVGVAGRQLSPTLEDAAALFVGGLLRTMMRTLPSHMSPLLNQLLSALVIRLHAATIPMLKTSLVLVLACAAHVSALGLVACLQSLPLPGGCTEADTLTFVMNQWTQWQPDIQGAYEIKLSTTGLAMLLATGAPCLGEVLVQGEPIVTESVGIVTRSRAKQQGPQQYTQLPLPTKIFTLLADALYESLEQQRGVKYTGANEESDGEWEDEDEDEYGDEVGLKEKGMGSMDFFERMLGAAPGFNDFSTEDLDAANDSINQTDVVEFLGRYLNAFAAQDKTSFDRCMQGLNPKHLEAVNKVLV